MPDNKPKKKDTKKSESKPLRLSDYNEYVSRKRAYDDSLATYQDSSKNRAKLVAAGMQKTGSSKSGELGAKPPAIFTHEYTGDMGEVVKKKVPLPQRTSPKIAPIQTNKYLGKPLIDQEGISEQQEISLPVYKKPQQRVEFSQPVERSAPIEPNRPAIIKKHNSSITQRNPGYKRVASSDDKYKNQREYATYVKPSGPSKEDPFKKKVIAQRQNVLSKNTTNKPSGRKNPYEDNAKR